MPTKLWKKGDPSPNPKGRPPVFSLTDMIRRKLQEIPPEYKNDKKSYADLLVGSVLRKGIIEKDHKSQKLIMNYIEGMPKQMVVNVNSDAKELPPELKAKINKAIDEL